MNKEKKMKKTHCFLLWLDNDSNLYVHCQYNSIEPFDCNVKVKIACNIVFSNTLIFFFLFEKSNTYSAVDEWGKMVWNFENFKLIYRYRLSTEYTVIPIPLPAPFSLIDFVAVFFRKEFWKVFQYLTY